MKLFTTVAVAAIAFITYQLVHSPRHPWPYLRSHLHRMLPLQASVQTEGKSSMNEKHHVSDVIVIGGGLAGVTAIRSALHADSTVSVIVIEKQPQLGGNSMKASSGINAVTPSKGDDVNKFVQDTLASGRGLSNPTLAHRLAADSQAAIEYLQTAGRLALDGIVQLGGHSTGRTHTPKTGPNVGFAIMKAQIAAVTGATTEDGKPRVLVLTSSRVVKLAKAPNSTWEVALQRDGEAAVEKLRCRAVVLATGGFGASKQLLQQHAPAVAALATTNGAFATGDGLQLGAHIGANTLHLDQVQVHPTGFVDPKDPDAGTKFLAPEKLRGVGGMLLDAAGKRFVDELATRDKVAYIGVRCGVKGGKAHRVFATCSAAAIQQLPSSRAWLVLDSEMAAEYNVAALGFYASKGMIQICKTMVEAAQHMQLQDASLFQAAVASYAAAAQKGTDEFGRTVFPARMSSTGPYYIMQVTPVIHYTMGGLAIDEEARILTDGGTAIPGVFGAGEVTGGLHGANRLGGNSLAECAVFGRIAGRNAAQYALQHRRGKTGI